jgi:lactate permease
MNIDLLLTIFPFVLLIWLMVKSRPWPANLALPLTAAIFYGVMVFYFKQDAILVNAAMIDGILTALTPILIVGGAVLLFKTMEHSGCLDMIRGYLDSVTTNKVGQLMIIGWSFSFLIEGISGFGTPAALAAPLLVGLGFSPIPVVVLCLIMNSAAVSFGAVGMPTWFGLGELNLNSIELARLGFRTAALHTSASFLIPILALRVVVSSQEIKKNLIFIYLSIASSVIPYLLISMVSVEFPSVVGGFIGFGAAIFFAKHKIGLAPQENTASETRPIILSQAVKAFFPLWGTVLVLLITRVPFLGLKEWLLATTPSWNFFLGGFGELAISSSLVIELKNILGTGMNWKHAILYVPSVIPFVLISLVTLSLFNVKGRMASAIWHDTWARIHKPGLALLGAMVFVKLIMLGGTESRAAYIGKNLSDGLGPYWQFIGVYLGALGAFLSGSNTVSNLVFGPVQDSLAASLDMNRISVLSLQSVGGAMGSMVSINNIVAVCSILGLDRQEGAVLKKTVYPMLVYGVIVSVVSFFI